MLHGGAPDTAGRSRAPVANPIGGNRPSNVVALRRAFTFAGIGVHNPRIQAFNFTGMRTTLMQTFGAEMTGYQRTLPRTKLLRKHRARAAFRGEEERRARLVAELRKARLTGIRVKGAC